MKRVFWLLLLVAASCETIFPQNQSINELRRMLTLQERLNQQTDFIPQNAAPAEQLIEIAQRFKIPMAIEWLDVNEKSKSTLAFNKGSVLDLINAVMRQSPEQQLIVEERILNISAPMVASHPYNFLNLRIEIYEVKKESLFGAQAWLRTGINMMLYPKLYENGYAGGYGGGSPHAFWKENITFSGEDLTIREILTKIAEESGNALWIVRLKRDEFVGDKPKWVGIPIDDHGHSPLNTRWQFLPLTEEESNNSLKPQRN